MRRTWLALFVLLPLLVLLAYVVAAALITEEQQPILYWENGAVELASALCFLIAGLWAIRLAFRARETPGRYRLFFLAFGLTGILACLEEISYGQHFFRWDTPGWFVDHNHQKETNLHNLGGDTTRRLVHLLGGIAFPLGAILIPLIAMSVRGTYRPGHWTWWVLPAAELFTIIGLEELLRLIKRLPPSMLSNYWRYPMDEVREMCWAVATVLYVAAMWQRHVTDRAAADPIGLDHHAFNRAA